MRYLNIVFSLICLFITVDMIHAQRMFWDDPSGKVFGGGFN